MRSRRIGGYLALLVIVLTVAGCIQSASGDNAFAASNNLNPTWTPSPVAPVLVTQEVAIIVTATPDPNQFFYSPTPDPNLAFAFVPSPTVDPFFAQAQQVVDPIFLTATYIVQGATATMSYNLTATAGGGFFFPTNTPQGFFDPNAYLTQTAAALSGIIQPTSFFVSGTDCVHEVRAEDRNLYRISLKYGLTVAQIANANNIANVNMISIGQRLVIPGCGTTGAFPPATSVPSSGLGVATVNAFGVATATPQFFGTGTTYTVQQGDTLFVLSLRYGVPVSSIAAANGIANWDRIYLGQQLVIPSS